MSLSRWEDGWRSGLVFPAVDLGFEELLCREGCDHQRLQVLWQLTISIPYYDPWSNSTRVHVSSLNGILDTSTGFGLQNAFEQLCSMKKIKSTFLLDGGINFYFPTNYENVRNMQHLRAVFLIHQIITVNQNEKEWAGVEWHHYGAKCFPSRAAFVECAHVHSWQGGADHTPLRTT